MKKFSLWLVLLAAICFMGFASQKFCGKDNFIMIGFINKIFSENESVKYKLDFGTQDKNWKRSKDAYAPGEKVRAVYDYRLIGTDTDYSIYVDDKKIKYEYKEKQGLVIEFIMPAKDVKITVKQSSSMM